MLLKSAVKKFLRSLEANGRRDRTIDSYEQRLKGMLRFFDARGITTIEAVESDDLDIWVVKIRRQEKRWEDYRDRPVMEGGLSEATIAGRIQSAKAFFNFCVHRGHLERSPAIYLRQPKVDLSAGDKVMRVEDLLALVEVAEEQAAQGMPRDLALLLFIYETGCRAGEAASVQIEDVRLVEWDALVEGKTGKREVDYTKRTADALQAWLKARPDVGHDFVFVGRRGNGLTPGGMYRVLERLAKKAGIDGRFNPHAVRHLVGQTWADKVNLELARQKLGHKDIAITAKFYSHQDRTRVKAATQELSVVNQSDAYDI